LEAPIDEEIFVRIERCTRLYGGAEAETQGG
jgi:hypothetical protein